jgi:mRNA interferase RelE/StbE
LVWRVELSEGAKKDLRRCDPQSARRILKFLRERIAVKGDPRRIGKRLRSPRLGEFWRYRAGDWRIICRIQDEIVLVLVLKVGHRRTVYRAQ